jgi:hypothetical protein
MTSMESNMFKNLTSPKTSRIAASVAAIVLVAIAALHAYWAFGGSWALSTATAGTTKTTSTGFQVFAGVIAVLALLAAIEILAIRAGDQARMHRLSSTKLVWAMVLILAAGGVARTASAPAVGLTAIVLAALFATVVSAKPPGSAA